VARRIRLLHLLTVALMALASARASADTSTVRFDDLAAGPLAPAGLVIVGTWSVTQGAARTSSEQAFIRPLDSPWLRSGRVEAVVRVTADLRQTGWRLAALQLQAGPEDSWDLALVIGLQGERYCELVERYRGAWQAQSEEPTRLEALPDSRREAWEIGEWYRLQIETTESAVRGHVTALDSGTVVCDLGYALTPKARAIRGGQVALRTDGVETEVRSLMADGESLTASLRRSDKVGVLTEAMPGGDPALGGRVADALAAEFAVARLSADEALSLTPGEAGTLVLPDAARLPGRMAGAIDRYVAAGGRLLVIGGPLLKTRYARVAAGWLPVDEALASVRPEAILSEFPNGLDGWPRSTGPTPAQASVSADAAPDGSKGVRVSVPDLQGWDTYQLPHRDSLLPEGHSLVCLWARGSERTQQLLVEVVEKDGSRWIATVPIGPEWRHCAVPTSAFHYWNDSPTRNRGAAGDYLHPQNADRMAIGIAVGHEPGGISPGAHEWSAAQLGTAASPLTDEDMDPLALECLLPWYKQFKLDDVGQVGSTLQGGVLGVRVPGGELAGPAWCSISRPAGMTWRDGDTLGRFVPLLQSVDSTGEARANLAWMWDVHAGVYSPGRWAQLALPYSDDLAPTLLALVRGLDRPVMLARAGTGAWSYFDDEPGQELGAYVLAKDASGPLTVRFVVRTEDGRTVADESSDIRPEGGRMTLARAERVTGLQAGFYSVRVTLLSEGKPIDVLDQPFTVLPARAPAEGRVHLSADGTHFEVDGRQFHPHGCNYWPLYVAGADSAQYWGHWLSPSQYDPEAVERDLRILERLGGNLVSIQYANEGQARPLADFLARCARHGIRANVFLPSTHPLAFDRELARRLIEAARLAGNPSVFAYDLAWEPHLGPYESRRAYDPQWRQWLADQYGSIEAAEAVFGMPLPRDSAAEVTGPSDAQLVQPSPATGPDIMYRAAGIAVLKNQGLVMETAAGSLWLCGVDDEWGGNPDPEAALRDRPEGMPSLMVAHNPVTALRFPPDGPDLCLCGHTHGGQWRYPSGKAIWIPQRRKLNHASGWKRVGHTWVYVSRGLGGGTLPFRLNCRPEITLLSLAGPAP